ncbi:methyltransferase domain-containing protein [archaeon]|jgi:methylation protein EvaC|nr:methyltransferase domain-containing protein [archaeon]MBT4373101.1 methyltransferase domain-containing protein [archaeon]MBT4531446.1 methyltransferase domain-containing protein [archaeon]MBT7001376.1 methyltransferase domain-containing protein [archaeon]MBT7282138.1 methyltransferase domain-containing protein [archaeon]
MESEKSWCKVCNTNNLARFISFGRMPVANAYVTKDKLTEPEYSYNMEVGFCEKCKMVQLINIVPYDKYIVPDETGKTQYAYFSSTSNSMKDHFAEMAKDIEQRFLDDNSKILETGSNDGIMLQAFNNHEVLGVEPSANVAEVAMSKGVPTIVDFFTETLANKIKIDKGTFRAILSTNVTLNIIDIHSYLRGVCSLLDDRGIFVTEDPYLGNILETLAYDQIYDEHVWYFSLSSLSNLYEMHGLEIFDAEKQEVHGGSMRVFACKKGTYEKTERLNKYLFEEKEKGIDTLEPYLEFANKVEKNKNKLQELISSLKTQGKRIVGYGAASKGTIVQNYCNLNSDLIEYISDSTEFKQGKHMPGSNIPIVTPEVFHKDHAVDYAVLFAWNHSKEIMKKEQDFINRGGRFIVHLPEPQILEPDQLTEEAEILESVKKVFAEEIPPRIVQGEFLEIKKLNTFANDQGYLFETLRADDSIYEGKFGQVLISSIYPGIIKGFHLHKKQIDYTACVKGNLKYVALKPMPDGSFEMQTIILGERNPLLIKCPPGIWHGYMPLTGKEAMVLHIADRPFYTLDPDTERKDPFEFGDLWTPKNG